MSKRVIHRKVGHTWKKMSHFENWSQHEKWAGYPWKNGSHLEKWFTLEEWGSLETMGHIQKDWRNLQKWIKLKKMGKT